MKPLNQNRMKTAVEWLQDTWLNYPDLCSYDKIQEWFKQAKAMEKEQIIDACKQCSYSYEEAEQYYKETFKSENVVMFMNTENSGIESIKLTDNPDCGIKGITFKSE